MNRVLYIPEPRVFEHTHKYLKFKSYSLTILTISNQDIMESQSLHENEVFDGIDYDDSADFEGEPILKKSRKEEIQWDEPKEYVLVCTYKKYDAYMKSAAGRKKGLSMENKRLVAFNQLKAHAAFSLVSHLLTPSGVAAKFMRLKKAVIGKYAMDGEGANLSGLPENPPRVEEALYKMVEEEFQGKVRQGKKQEKEANRVKRVQEIQDRMLQNMVRTSPNEGSNPTLVPGPPPAAAAVAAAAGGGAVTTAGVVTVVEEGLPPVSQDSGFTSSLSSGSTRPTESTEQVWQRIIERREARRSEEKEGAASLAKTLVAMEEKRLQLEEQRMQLEARRIEVEATKAENERQMFNYFLQQRNSNSTN